MTMEYIPNALAFIFVVNVVNAGGLQDDRVRLFFNLRQSLDQIIFNIKTKFECKLCERVKVNLHCPCMVDKVKAFFFYMMQFTKGKYDFNTVLHLSLREKHI